MTKYYIKDGYSEKGPLTIEDLKKLKISTTTFVRLENNNNWVQADSLQELQSVLKDNFRILKITGLTFLAIVLIAAIIIGISYINLESSSSYEPFIEVEEPIPPPPAIDFTVSKHEKLILREKEIYNLKNPSLKNLKKTPAKKSTSLEINVKEETIKDAGSF